MDALRPFNWTGFFPSRADHRASLVIASGNGGRRDNLFLHR
ncbi:hypothetical protein [Mycobacterium sp. 23]